MKTNRLNIPSQIKATQLFIFGFIILFLELSLIRYLGVCRT